ncbi:ribulose-phosphate 3-epimerase [Rickettsiales endosymbiont of Stachyamoeba lipophora]|uniref:ribulose-phosphate 3-epimerase n=1 Tax=Rickettsiales endosymbiont of Stachyamoeba lipophora TaxID=2486578 RepID=UPI000F6561C0|nr:ribulose-phosphate 3-epimerase [Rickettsiales endosymbiont of Stachyamoeba lipophora]AZL15047.1 ribulose-phosphate 3-epimerase [Rickettsiales endosymbiont of Stachyamoeba lipophora]
MNKKIKVSASILSCDFSNLQSEISKIAQSTADYLHLDVMDGNFVPNITLGAEIIKQIRPYSTLPFDTHLMINNPEQHIAAFAQAGSDIITIHQEAVIHLDSAITQIKSFGKKAGVSIVPTTHESNLEYILEKIDLILVMTVNPGFGGQKFLTSQLKKIEQVRKMIDKINPQALLEVDGGINEQTAKLVIEAGADVLVSGSYLFNHPQSFNTAIKSLKNE